MVSLAKTKEPPHNVLYRRLGHIGEEMLKKITQDKEIKKCGLQLDHCILLPL